MYACRTIHQVPIAPQPGEASCISPHLAGISVGLLLCRSYARCCGCCEFILQQLCPVQQVLFHFRRSLPVRLSTLSFSVIPEPYGLWGGGVTSHLELSTQHCTVSYCLHRQHLWISVLITSWGLRVMLTYGSEDENSGGSLVLCPFSRIIIYNI